MGWQSILFILGARSLLSFSNQITNHNSRWQWTFSSQNSETQFQNDHIFRLQEKLNNCLQPSKRVIEAIFLPPSSCLKLIFFFVNFKFLTVKKYPYWQFQIVTYTQLLQKSRTHGHLLDYDSRPIRSYSIVWGSMPSPLIFKNGRGAKKEL